MAPCRLADSLQTLADSLQKSETEDLFILEITMFLRQKSTKPGQIQSEDLFLEITVFLGQKIEKIGTDSKL